MAGSTDQTGTRPHPGVRPIGDKSTPTQRDPVHTPHAYVRPGDNEKRGCVKCGRLPAAPVHADQSSERSTNTPPTAATGEKAGKSDE